jgi:rhamnose transport system permease protein
VKNFLKNAVTQPEFLTVVLLFGSFGVCALLSPYFLDVSYLLNSSTLYVETGLLALAMTLVIVAGQIDLSVASILALVTCLTAWLNQQLGIPWTTLLLLVPCIGFGLGAVNGCLVAYLGLPSLAVTLATMALYRGTAQVLLGDHSLRIPDWLFGFDYVHVPGTQIPVPLALFFLAAILFAIVLHKTVFGRWIIAVGTNEGAARFSGIPITRVKFLVFAISGLTASLAGMMCASRLGVARFDHARGLELDVITAVVLGGTNIFGGRGTIFGSVVALMLIATLKTGMGVANVKAENQLAVVGSLLIAAVIANNLIIKLRPNS